MIRSACRRRAAFSLLAVLFGAAAVADGSARAETVAVPAYRPLQAAEPMSPPGSAGSDFSANPPSLSGLTLLATIPAPSSPRRGYLIQAQCAAGLTVVLDRESGGSNPTRLILAGAQVNGGQGGTLDMAGIPHTGKIEIYSSAADCQMAARAW
jgi:hypothetical protein